jgi:biotin carboxyl carrier protein
MSKRVTVIVEGREYIVEVGDLGESPVKATVNNRTYQVEVPQQETSQHAPEPEPETPVATRKPPDRQDPPKRPARAGKAINAPMPGNIIEVRVKAGDSIQPGDVVCVLEAMKMNNMIYADRPGVIASVEVVAGQAVDYGAPLVTFR